MGDLTRTRLGSRDFSPFSLGASMAECAAGGAGAEGGGGGRAAPGGFRPFAGAPARGGGGGGGGGAKGGGGDAAAYEGAASAISCGAVKEARRMRTRLSPRCTSSSATPVSVARAISSRISSTVING